MAQMVKVSACNVGDPDLIPGWGRSSGEGNGNHAEATHFSVPHIFIS